MIKVNAIEGAKALNHSVVDIHRFASRVSPTGNSSHSLAAWNMWKCNLVFPILFCLSPDFKFALLTMLDYDLVMALGTFPSALVVPRLSKCWLEWLLVYLSNILYHGFLSKERSIMQAAKHVSSRRSPRRCYYWLFSIINGSEMKAGSHVYMPPGWIF